MPLVQAYSFGQRAWSADLPCEPTKDPEFMAWKNGSDLPIGSSHKVLDAWLRGWREAETSSL